MVSPISTKHTGTTLGLAPSEVARCPTRAPVMRRRNPGSISVMPRLAITIFLREADVKALLTMDATLAALVAAFREWAGGGPEPSRNPGLQPRRRPSRRVHRPAQCHVGGPGSGDGEPTRCRGWRRNPDHHHAGGAAHLSRRVAASRSASKCVRLELPRSPG